MIIGINNCEVEATPANTAIFTGETMLSGIYVDIEPDDYLFIPEDLEMVRNYPEIALSLKFEGVAIHELVAYDPQSEPFCFMINALCRVFACEIEDTFGGSDGS
jgi:hypothetical protein